MAQRRRPDEECMSIMATSMASQTRGVARFWLGQQRIIGQPAIFRDKAMDLSAVRAEQADRKLPDVRQTLHVGMDAADDIAAGGWTGEDQRTHRTTR